MPWSSASRGRTELHRLAVDDQLAVVVRVQPGHDLDQGRLAGAVVAEDAGDLAGVDGQVDPLERADGAVGLADVDHLDQRHLVQGGALSGVRSTVAVMSAHLFAA